MSSIQAPYRSHRIRINGGAHSFTLVRRTLERALPGDLSSLASTPIVRQTELETHGFLMCAHTKVAFKTDRTVPRKQFDGD